MDEWRRKNTGFGSKEIHQSSDTSNAVLSLLKTYGCSESQFSVLPRVKEIGFSPLKNNFVVAISVLVTMRKSVWDSRFEVYQRWGWNHEMSLRAFRKFPGFMIFSGETFTKKMSFLVKDMGWPSEAIAEYPQVVAYSLEKRIIPRFSVIKILKSKGVLEKNMYISSIICITEEKFLEKFVVNFQNVLPFLPDVYRGVINPSNVL
ncbi:hypothetical protein glysoja_006503 [Glycine soja]|nr:hypothetical protein glysoja_006503 [Glycine soja]